MTFVEINYTALPETVLGAELFGYEENPFTRTIAITISTNAIKNYFRRHLCLEKALISRKWPEIEKYN
jgi:transcriptional regulator of acetoin/glycerol metabolism